MDLLKLLTILWSILLITEALDDESDLRAKHHKEADEGNSGSAHPEEPLRSTTVGTTTESYFSDMPEEIKIVYIEAETLIKFDNKGERVMGIADEKCDTGQVNLETDFDPENETEIELHTKCFEDDVWKPNDLNEPILTIMNSPRRYVPIHKCMHVRIKYIEQIPTIGPHRPLWARYGEYEYLPPQRWLHNVEHGAIVGLYHPCADPELVDQLRNVIESCLYRFIITPYLNLTRERPIALVGWSASLEMSHFDLNLCVNFIKFYARTGPERVFRDGQYRHLLKHRADIVTNIIDVEVCPDWSINNLLNPK